MCNPSPSGGFIENHHPSQPISDPSCIEVCWCHQRQWHCSLKQIGEIRRTGSALRQLGVSSTCQRPWHDCANRRSMGMLLQNPCYKIQIFETFWFQMFHHFWACIARRHVHSLRFPLNSVWQWVTLVGLPRYLPIFPGGSTTYLS